MDDRSQAILKAKFAEQTDRYDGEFSKRSTLNSSRVVHCRSSSSPQTWSLT